VLKTYLLKNNNLTAVQRYGKNGQVVNARGCFLENFSKNTLYTLLVDAADYLCTFFAKPPSEVSR
jgi:hypothetical protein